MLKSKKTYSNIFKLIFRIFIVILAIYYTFTISSDPSSTSYIWGCIIVLAASFGIDLFFLAVKIELSSALDLFIQIFVMLSLLLGRMYNMYDIIPWWDLMLHFLSGFLFSVLFLALLKFMTGMDIYDRLSPAFVFVYIVFFSIAGAAIWEFWEFAGDQIFGTAAQLRSLIDTMTDMIIGSVSGFITGFLCFFNVKSGRFKFLNSFTFTMKKSTKKKMK